MIQLRRARFENFRLLRNIEIEFSADAQRPLTVVRAENDTGKTTLLNGLSWALFGDKALPGSRTAFRLHPIDWQADQDGAEVPIKVVVEFAAVDEETGQQVVYELERSTIDRLAGATEFEASPATITLLRHTNAGVAPVDNPSSTIEALLPTSLRDVFFIDGDRALAFIETTDEQRIKRDRVAKAVRSLLGLDLLEDADRHVDNARREAVATIKKLGAGTDVERLAADRQRLEDEQASLRASLEHLKSDLVATETRHRKADKRLKDALASGAGAQRELGIRLEKAEAGLQSEQQAEVELLAAHRRLLNSPSLTIALAPGPIASAAQLLADLEQRKVIPSTLPNVIEDRLAREECICGASLTEGTKERAHLENLLAESRQMDESKELLRWLNEGVKRTLRDLRGDDPWAQRLRTSQRSIQRCLKRQHELEDEVGELRAQTRGESVNLEELERIVGVEEREVKRLLREIAQAELRDRQLDDKIRQVDRERTAAERKNAKVQSGVTRETVAKDILDVIRATVRVLQGETLDEVSGAMNDIFMSMIVADSEAGSVIREVQLTREHDIVVVGPGGRTIDPDIDLNGASRRALTLAFILALVKVSGVKAPNIIDTPLGMMGVEVRQAVLQYASMNSTQLVMFLTGSEIIGVEDLLDAYAGKVYTLTNAAHYPSKLINYPGTTHAETLMCSCNHRQTCDLCRRRVPLLERRIGL